MNTDDYEAILRGRMVLLDEDLMDGTIDADRPRGRRHEFWRCAESSPVITLEDLTAFAGNIFQRVLPPPSDAVDAAYEALVRKASALIRAEVNAVDAIRDAEIRQLRDELREVRNELAGLRPARELPSLDRGAAERLLGVFSISEPSGVFAAVALHGAAELLLEAADKLRVQLRASRLCLRVSEADPERLYVVATSLLELADAHERLTRFEREWWFEARKHNPKLTLSLDVE